MHDDVERRGIVVASHLAERLGRTGSAEGPKEGRVELALQARQPLREIGGTGRDVELVDLERTQSRRAHAGHREDPAPVAEDGRTRVDQLRQPELVPCLKVVSGLREIDDRRMERVH